MEGVKREAREEDLGEGGIVGKYGGGFDCFLFLFWNLIVVAIKIKFYF